MTSAMLTPNPIHKKAFPLHYDVGAYHQDPEAIRQEIERGEDLESVMAGMQGSFLPKPPIKRFYRRHKYQFNDPIGTYWMVDALIMQQRGTYIRPHFLTTHLSNQQPLYYWDTRPVGRALSGLATACWEEYRNPDGTALDVREVPLGRGRDARGAYYVLDPKGGNEGLFWLMNVRKVLLRLSSTVMQAEAVGNFDFSLGNKAEIGYNQNLAQPADLYSEWFEGTRVRDQQDYLAQCDGEPFMRSQPVTVRHDSDVLA